MRPILDARGKPVDPVERAVAEMQTRLAECIFGDSPDDRVRRLRATVTGETETKQITGLLAALEEAS